MARIRSVKVDQFLDDGLTEVSLEAHFLLLGLPCLADSAGRLEDRPRKIQALLFAYRPKVRVDALLSELVRSGHVQRYASDGDAYIQILEWDRDQRPHKNEPESSIPAPPQRYTDVGHVSVPGIPESDQGNPEEKSAAGIRGMGCGVKDPDPPFPPSAIASAASGQGELLSDTPVQQALLPRPETRVGAPQEAPPNGRKRAATQRKALAGTHDEPPTQKPEPAPFKAACDMLTRVYSEVRKADYGFGLNAKRNGKAVRELLWGDGAKGEGRGEPLVAMEEIERRWRVGLAWKGFPTCSAIWDLRDNWAAYAQPQDGRATPDAFRPAQPDTCAGCGERGQGGTVGDPEVWLGYECGCLPAFAEAQSRGLHFTKAAEWATTRKRAA